MRELTIDSENPDAAALAEAAETLRAGGLVVVPTDTVYGLAGRLFDTDIIERIFAVKGRSPAKGLIAMIADPGDLDTLCGRPTAAAWDLASRFWPGPLTIVAEARSNIPTRAVVNGKIGVRLPDYGPLRSLIRAVGEPLAVTSANLSGRPSPVDITGIRAEFVGRVDLILNAGPCALGVESTVVDTDADPLIILREGALSVQVLLDKGTADDNG